MPYVIRKCDSYSYGRNDWYDVKVTASKEDAISYVRSEMYLLYASDPDISSDDIDRHMNGYYHIPKPGQHISSRHECGHNGTHYAIINSTAAKYDSWVGQSRPNRTELLDNILGA